MEYKKIIKQIEINLYSYEQNFGIKPNVVKLSANLFQELQRSNVFSIRSENEITVFGIDLEVDYSKQDSIKVGYMQ